LLLDLPPGPDQAVLRAGLMALRVPPTVAPANAHERDLSLLRLLQHPQGVAFVDISNPQAAAGPMLSRLDALIPRDQRRGQVFLTRLADAHVSTADRHWVRRMGFADLLGDLSAVDSEGELRRALDGVAARLGLESIKAPELARYVRVMNDTNDTSSPRALIRACTGLSAEELANQLARSLRILDRTYRLQTYPACFVGNEAVAWLANHLQRPRVEAVALGQALMAMGLLAHVTHEHPFQDEHLFYRLALSAAADRLDPGRVMQQLAGPGGVAVADRVYLAKTYTECWVGSEAIDWLVQVQSLERHDAWVLLHRLMQFGLIEHVTRSRSFIDGYFFYRFAGQQGVTQAGSLAKP
jgi:hypothetical protein